jgi:hypothetical protein
MRSIKNYNLFLENDGNAAEAPTLEKLQEEYKKYREWGNNQAESAEEAVNATFVGGTSKPYIYKDSYGDASHVFLGERVLFFGGGIYIKEKVMESVLTNETFVPKYLVNSGSFSFGSKNGIYFNDPVGKKEYFPTEEEWELWNTMNGEAKDIFLKELYNKAKPKIKRPSTGFQKYLDDGGRDWD